MRLHRPALLLALATTALISGCNQSSNPQASSATSQARALPVSVAAVHISQQKPQKTLLAKAISPADVQLKSKTTGLVEVIHYQDGTTVKAGDVLYTVEGENLKLALQKAEAELQTQKASLTQLTREATRQSNLFASKAASQQDYDDALSAKAVQQATVNAALASVNLARKEYNDSLIKAPYSGVLGQASVAVGDYVSPGSVLNTLTQIDPVWITVGIAQTDYDRLYPKGSEGASLDVVLTSGEVVQRGRLDYVSPAVDSEYGSVTVRASVPNTEGKIKPGQFVTARLYGEELTGVAKVPQKAVQVGSKGPYVYVANAGKAELKTVGAQNWDGQFWTVSSGLSEGDQVITDNLLNLHPGADVSINAPVKAEQ